MIQNKTTLGPVPGRDRGQKNISICFMTFPALRREDPEDKQGLLFPMVLITDSISSWREWLLLVVG